MVHGQVLLQCVFRGQAPCPYRSMQSNNNEEIYFSLTRVIFFTLNTHDYVFKSKPTNNGIAPEPYSKKIQNDHIQHKN